MHQTVTMNSPANTFSIAFFEMSSATKEVATLRRGILNNFDTMLNTDMETPAEANATEPEETQKKKKSVKKMIKPRFSNFEA